MTMDELNNARPELKGCICLNQKQTADIIGVSSSTLDNWRKIGLGPQFKKIDSGKRGRVLYPKNAIIEWLSNTVKTV